MNLKYVQFTKSSQTLIITIAVVKLWQCQNMILRFIWKRLMSWIFLKVRKSKSAVIGRNSRVTWNHCWWQREIKQFRPRQDTFARTQWIKGYKDRQIIDSILIAIVSWIPLNHFTITIFHSQLWNFLYFFGKFRILIFC